MRRSYSYYPTLLLSLLALAGAAGQEDPFGVPKAGAEAAPAAKAAQPPDVTKREPLTIEMLRAANPSTPLELIQAAQAALRYGRPDESKRYLEKLLTSQPGDESLAPLTARYGDFLLQLDRTKELQPEGKLVSDLVLAAAERMAQDPERIAALIAQLSDPRPGVQQDALGQLSRAGVHVVNPMLQVLADTSREKEHANVRSALVRLGGATEQPLLGALDTSNESLRPQVVSVLGRIGTSRAATRLVRLAVDPQQPAELRKIAAAGLQRISGATPDLYEARKYLQREAKSYLAGNIPFDFDVDGRVVLWVWNDATQQVAPIVLSRGDAAVLLAGRTAGDLYAISPQDPAALDLLLLTSLELAKVQFGLDQPLPRDSGAAKLGLQAGPPALSRVLASAMHDGRVPAAIAAAELLGLCGDESVLHAHGTIASPLADAMTYPDRRVRLAAALSAVKLAPGASFAGAGRVAETLVWFIGSTGADVALIGHPRGEEAQSLVGFMNALGMQGEAAYIGRLLTQRAFESPDHPFILISNSIDMPPAKELIQWLRRDFRTARQPVGVMARGDGFEALKDAWSDDPFTIVFPRIHSDDVAAAEVAKLKAIAGRNLVGADERLAQAKAAFLVLIALAESPATLLQYDLLRHQGAVIRALETPQLATAATALLARFGTPQAQTALIDFASQNSRALPARQAAAAAFAAAVKSRGLLLTQQQIALQYERYNASQSLDKPTQELLSSIIDAIEAPAIARGELTRRE